MSSLNGAISSETTSLFRQKTQSVDQSDTAENLLDLILFLLKEVDLN